MRRFLRVFLILLAALSIVGLASGAFNDSSSVMIFEDKNKGMLA